MINFIKNLIAAPFRIVFWLCSFFPAVKRLTLGRIIWNITGEPADGCNVIILTANSKGIEPARKVALKVLQETHDAAAALMMGQLEVHACCDVHAAFEWIKKAKDMDCKNPESLLKLELMISDTLDQIDTEQVIEQILSRNDLPGDYTKDALQVRMEIFLRDKKWDAAEEIADRILSVEEDSHARATKWVVAAARGNNDQAQMHFKKINNNVPPVLFHANLAMGWYHLGQMDKAREHLTQCIKNGANPNLLVIVNPSFKELLLQMRNDFYKEAQ
jgi:tetratricopeptide (TPR) repeat protein